MSRQASSRTIGAFVLGGIAIAIAGVITFGSGTLFRQTDRYVLYFDESLKGLRVGAPVVFRGVTLGSVTNIKAVYDVDTTKIVVPVEFETIDGTVEVVGDVTDWEGTDIGEFIERGLRAKLQMESFVTGQLFIELSFMPNTEPKLTGLEIVDAPEVPTLPSDWARLQRSIDDLIVSGPERLETIDRIIGNVDELLGREGVQRLVESLDSLADVFDTLADPDNDLVQGLRHFPVLMQNAAATAEKMPALVDNVERLSARLDLLLANLDSSIVSRDTQLGAAIGNAADTADAVRRMSDQLNNMVAENREGIEDFTEVGLPELIGLIEDTTRMVNELDATLRDMRQDPARFFFGNSSQQGIDLQ